MTKKQFIDIIERVASTFVFSFLAAWVVTGVAINKISLVAALAAGLSAVKNYLKQTYNLEV